MDSTRFPKKKTHWRGRLTVLALFGLGLLAIVVLYVASRLVPAPPPGAHVPPESPIRR